MPPLEKLEKKLFHRVSLIYQRKVLQNKCTLKLWSYEKEKKEDNRLYLKRSMKRYITNKSRSKNWRGKLYR